jgi:C4-dicarboxylate-specific signal transduction histidine kinase
MKLPEFKLSSAVQRYGLALLSCAIALALSFPTHAPESCFLVAVIVSNLWGGRGPGLLSVGLTALSLDYFFLPPAYHLSLDLASLGGIAAFLVATLIVTFLLDAKRRAEDALQKTEATLAQAQQFAAVGEMSAAIAHEVNQPLSAIVANASACIRWLATDPPTVDKANEAAERIVRDGKDAGEVIRHVRSLFKRGLLEKVPLDINDIIQESLRLLRGEIARRRLNVETELAEGLPLVNGDRVQLQQLVLNLLINALEAMDPVTDRARQIVIRSEAAEPGVLVAVRDYGVGFESADRIFDPFFTTKEQGMGMGLAISRSIVEAHEGRLWAASKRDAGTTFSFTLPSVPKALSASA